MTRKSDARVKRDQMAKSLATEEVVSPYVELENMFQTQIALFPEYRKMAALISHPEVAPFLKDATHTDALLRGLGADAADLFQKTQEERKGHAGKTAMPNAIDEDENWNIIMHFQNYQMYMGVHTQTIVPIMLELDEHLQYALRAREAAQANAVAAAQADQPAVNLQIVESGGMSYQADDKGNPIPLGGGIVQRDGMSSRVDAQGNPVPHGAAPTMAGYEAAATVH